MDRDRPGACQWESGITVMIPIAISLKFDTYFKTNQLNSTVEKCLNLSHINEQSVRQSVGLTAVWWFIFHIHLVSVAVCFLIECTET